MHKPSKLDWYFLWCILWLILKGVFCEIWGQAQRINIKVVLNSLEPYIDVKYWSMPQGIAK